MDDEPVPTHLPTRQRSLLEASGNGGSLDDAKSIGDNVVPATTQVRLPFSREWTVKNHNDAMAEFQLWLSDRRKESLVNRPYKWIKMGPRAVQATGNILFVQMMSLQALQRFNINTVELDPDSVDITAQLVEKATNLSGKNTLPKAVRNFFSWCSTYWGMLRDRNAQFYLSRDMFGVRMYAAFVQMKVSVREHPNFWNQIFAQEAIFPRPGHDIHTRVLDFLCSPTCLDVH